MVDVNGNTLRILQNGLHNTISIRCATLASNSRHYCKRPVWEQQRSKKDKPRSETDLEETHQNVDNLHIVVEIVRHVGSGPQVKYVVLWYSSATQMALPSHLKT